MNMEDNRQFLLKSIGKRKGGNRNGFLANMISISATCILLSIFACSADAQVVRHLYLANDDHTDLMWTANEAQYDSAFVQMLDYFLNQIDSTISNPDDFRTRFNCDGSYWLRAYEKYRSPQQY